MVLTAVSNSSMSSNSWTHSMSTDSSAHTEQSSVYTHPLYRVSHYVWLVGPPIILVVGNFGNVMTIIIMHRQKSGETIINVYFTALAVVDLISLNVLLLGNWVGMTFGFYFNSQHDVICKLHSWTIACATTGAWFLVILTAHRAVSVVWPHRVNALCTRRLVVRVVVGIAVFVALAYSHYLYGQHVSYFPETKDYRCTMVTGSYAMFVQNIFSYVDLVLYCILPFICIVLANVVLVRTLRATVREVRVKFSGRESAAVDREKAASSVTLTIITVSLTFVVLTLPVSVYYISLFIYDPSAVMSVADQARSHLTRAVTYMMMFSNSAVNFYLYCLTGAKFRKEFVQILCPRGLRGA